MPIAQSLENRFHVIPFPRRSPASVYKRQVTRGMLNAQKPTMDDLLESFREHLQLAMMIELSTIPLYLYPHYSVETAGDPAAKTIRHIVIQEMLHLTLAGNILRAAGGIPILYHAKHFPRYPMLMVDRQPGLVLHLMPLNWVMIGIAREVEKRSYPYPTPPGKDQNSNGKDDEEYTSLGEFYEELQAFARDHLTDASFQQGAVSDQISNSDDIYTGSDLQTIQSVDDAVHAMETIIEQGEGAKGSTEDSHIKEFEQMQEPASLYPVPPEDPRTTDYIRSPNVVAVSNMFNASFCFLLLSIETIWVTPLQPQRGKLASNISDIMGGILRVIAPWLCKTPIGNGMNAAPTFEFWDYTTDGQNKETALSQLVQMKNSLPLAVLQDKDLQPAWAAIDQLSPLVPPPTDKVAY